MHKAKLVFEDLKNEYYQSCKVPIHWLSLAPSHSENYKAEIEQGALKVKAEGYLGAIQALQKIRIGLKSGHLQDFLGFHSPQFRTRCLMIGSSMQSLLGNSDKTHQFCKRILEMGYNSLLIETVEEKKDFTQLCKDLQNYGFKIILKFKPSQVQNASKRSPLDSSYAHFIHQQLDDFISKHPSFDFLFWESQWLDPSFLHSPTADAYTLSEAVLLEARLLENKLAMHAKSLVLYLPVNDSTSAELCSPWILNLADQLDAKTILAFSAVCGDYYADHLAPHPIWNKIRSRIPSAKAALMPILNIGNVRQGEGLWPILIQDLIDDYIMRCPHTHFPGVFCATHQIPQRESLLDCNLWVTGQVLWNPHMPSLSLFDTWFTAFRPEWNFMSNRALFIQLRNLSKQLNLLRSWIKEINRDSITSQECKISAESILIQLSEIQTQLEKQERKRLKKCEKTALGDYFFHFSNDAKKIILHVLQGFNLSLPQLLNEQELKESFWTDYNVKSGQGLRGSAQISFLETPNRGAPGSRTHAIYQENHLFV
ncbi:MAG: hypothetical protein BGO14_01870 [Chlamydiales bacterium 38-26]|mgnify:CR=1 FL=1|nr:hypothetical protein [Chlamydiales bacterium]OJV08192.1 MAG: hypothetical protein BGO14_01870 [Chlamydiales bacterium 38-26]